MLNIDAFSQKEIYQFIEHEVIKNQNDFSNYSIDHKEENLEYIIDLFNIKNPFSKTEWTNIKMDPFAIAFKKKYEKIPEKNINKDHFKLLKKRILSAKKTTTFINNQKKYVTYKISEIIQDAQKQNAIIYVSQFSDKGLKHSFQLIYFFRKNNENWDFIEKIQLENVTLHKIR